MFPLFIRNFEIKTAKKALAGAFQIIQEDRALVLVSSNAHPSPYKPGTVFIRNLKLRATSKNGTEWMAYEHGIYDAWRAGVHIDRNSGVAPHVENGELQEMFADIGSVRDYVYTLLDPVSFADNADFHRMAFGAVVRSLGNVRDERKLEALSKLLRAEQAKDKLGRNNPAAASMAAGSGIDRLTRRANAIRKILDHVSVRTLRIHMSLQDILERYESLLRLLGGRHGDRKHAVLWQLLLNQTANAMATTRRIISEQLTAFQHIHAEPFRKNGFHLQADLQKVLDLAYLPHVDRVPMHYREIGECYARIRQGITWALALHHLEMKIRAPLAWLMEDAFRDERIIRKAVNQTPDRDELVITRSFAPDRFDQIVGRVEDFRSRAAKCTETHLRHPLRDTVLATVDQTLDYMKQDDWREAKTELANLSLLF